MYVEAMMYILDFLGLFMTKISLEKLILNPYCMNMYAVLSWYFLDLKYLV
jgi:hypothetical protein